jgi:hypothetical protein
MDFEPIFADENSRNSSPPSYVSVFYNCFVIPIEIIDCCFIERPSIISYTAAALQQQSATIYKLSSQLSGQFASKNTEL